MKLNLKPTLTALFTAGALLASQAHAAGIPTFDAAAIAQWTNQANQMAEQIKQFEQQIQNQIDHLNAIKGARGVGKVDAVLDVFEKAPDEWADIYKIG
jgi:type IV secretion system protein VirB5